MYRLKLCVCWEPYLSWAPATAGVASDDGAIFASNSRVVREEPDLFEGLFMGDRTQRWQTTDVDLTPLDSDELQSLAGLLVVYILIFALWEKCEHNISISVIM